MGDEAEPMLSHVTRLEQGAIISALMERLGVNTIRLTRGEVMKNIGVDVIRRDDVATDDIIFTRVPK